MRKYFLSFVALAAGLFATSCQESIVEPQVAGPTTFTVQVPDQMGTKADGDSYKLFVEVYSADGLTKIHRLEDAITVGTPKTVSLNLVATQVYDIIFWAQKDGASYNVNDLNKVEITNQHHNSENGAAFYAIKNDYKPVEVNNPSVTLTRPFAQLNIGTIDEVSYGDNNGNKKIEILSTNIKVESAAKYFERINTQESPELGEGRTGVVFEYTGGEVLNSTMTIGEGANAKTYKQVSMDYISVLGNKDAVTVTATIEVRDPNGVESTIERVITNVPLQMNYRTNIVGNLITSASDFTIEISEAWGGTNDKEVVFREVATAAELQDAINDGVDNITLTDDIDLTETLVFGPVPGSNPIARASASETPSFVLDLGGKTINTGLENENDDSRHKYAIINYANLTIKGNGTINARGNSNYGVLTLENGTINAIDGNGGYAVRNYPGSEFIMNDGTVAATYEDGDAPGQGYDATPIRVDAGAKAVINDGEVTNISNYTFAIDNYGETTINGGTITSVHSTVSSYGNLTINGGSFTCNGLEGVTAHALVVWDGSKTTINGGEFDGKDNYNGFNVCAVEGSDVNITGGKFHRVHSGSLYGEGTITVSGGIFFDEIATERLAEGYCILPYTQGYYSVVAESNIVTTEEQLKACVEKGGEIVLNADIALSSTLIIEEGADVSINLNNHTISGSWSKTDGHIINNNGNLVLLNGTVSSEGANGGSAISNYGTLNVMNATINGASVRENEGWPAYPVNNYSDATFENVLVNGYQGAIACNAAGTTTLTECTINKKYLNTSSHVFYINHVDAKVVVNSGTYTHKGMDGSLAYVIKGRITVNGGEFTAEDGGYGIAALTNGEVIINGGTFNNAFLSWGGSISVLGGRFKNDPSNWLAEGFVADKVDDVWVVSSANVKIEGKVYSSLKNAVNDAKDGQTITLLNDIEQEDGVLIENKNITIDLNGKIYTVTEGASTNNRNFKINGSSEVTIKNGTMVAAGDYSSGAYGTLRTEGTAYVTLEDVKLYNYRGNGLNVKALSGTTVTITNTEIYSVYGGGVESAGGIIELTNVKVEQKGMYTAPYNSMTISVNGGGQVTVNSGTYSTECITAEEANNQGLSHGPWCAGVLNSGGTLIIKGGTFSNDNFGENSLATAARGLLLADTGANIQIEDGTFNAVKAIIDIQNNLGDASKNPKALLNGGDYSSNPLTWEGLISLGEGKTIKEQNNRWIIQ